MSTSVLPPSTFPIFTSIASYREWRRKAYDEKKSVGFVATLGALHEGHLELVKRSLSENDLTVISIFVNPAQFAPHEDLASYPRTLPRDLEVLSSLSMSVNSESGSSVIRTPSALFFPSVQEMYPAGISQDSASQKGTFVEVKGYGHQMEGMTRPHFFRGVATVVTKLFNVIEPTQTYFGQKDIQQALLLRRMTRDLLLSHPTPENLHIVPTARDPNTSLALSSRNAYLTPAERELAAPTLYAALQEGKSKWEQGGSKAECVACACAFVETKAQELSTHEARIKIKLDYIEMNDPDSFDVIPPNARRRDWQAGDRGEDGRDSPVILSGAMWVGRTRLIDNVVLGDTTCLGILRQ